MCVYYTLSMCPVSTLWVTAARCPLLTYATSMAAIRIRFGCLRRDVRHCIRYAAPVVLRVLPFCHTICSLAKYGGEIGCVDTSLSMRGSETGCVGTNRLEDEDHDASGQVSSDLAPQLKANSKTQSSQRMPETNRSRKRWVLVFQFRHAPCQCTLHSHVRHTRCQPFCEPVKHVSHHSEGMAV